MIDYAIPPEYFNQPPAYVRTADDVDLDYPEVTEYYPGEILYGSEVGEWSHFPSDREQELPFFSEDYTEYIYLIASRSYEGASITRKTILEVYFYGIYDTGNAYFGTNRLVSGNIYYFQVLGKGRIIIYRDNTYAYYYDEVYSYGDLYSKGYRFYSCISGSSFSFLTEAMLVSSGVDLSYGDLPLIMYPGYFNDNGILATLYNIGMFLGNIGDNFLTLINYKILGFPFYQILFGSGFFIYVGWLIVKWAIPL